MNGRSINWVAATVRAGKATVKKWRDMMVEEGRLAAPVSRATSLAPAKVDACLDNAERIRMRIEQAEVGGPEWRRRRMSATLEETYHEVMGAMQAEARRLRDPKVKLRQRDRVELIAMLGNQMRKMLALASGMISGTADIEDIEE